MDRYVRWRKLRKNRSPQYQNRMSLVHIVRDGKTTLCSYEISIEINLRDATQEELNNGLLTCVRCWGILSHFPDPKVTSP